MMSESRYRWRRLTDQERAETLAWRKQHQRPWHSPPHAPGFQNDAFHVTAACFEHRPYIGRGPERLESFSCALLSVLSQHASQTVAWCVLPNHYHALVRTPDVLKLVRELGLLHGRSSYAWNGEEGTRGRKVFFRCVEREMRSEAHFFATLNYVHHNPVHHKYVEKWTDWPWSSAAEFLERAGKLEAERIWKEYPVRDYGKGWDDAEL